MGCTSDNRGLSLGRGSRLHDPRPRSDLRQGRHAPTACHGHPGQAHYTSLTLAERLCRTADRIDPARVFGSRHCFGRGTSAPNSEKLCGLLQWRENASVSKQRCAGLSAGSAIRRHKFTRHLGRTSSPLRSGLTFRYTHPDTAAGRLTEPHQGVDARYGQDRRSNQPGRRLVSRAPADRRSARGICGVCRASQA
jgi:hypothetical protein